jgi:hypothetical protein
MICKMEPLFEQVEQHFVGLLFRGARRHVCRNVEAGILAHDPVGPGDLIQRKGERGHQQPAYQDPGESHARGVGGSRSAGDDTGRGYRTVGRRGTGRANGCDFEIQRCGGLRRTKPGDGATR